MKTLIKRWLGIEDLEFELEYYKKRADRYIEVAKANRGHISSYQSKIDKIENKLRKH